MNNSRRLGPVTLDEPALIRWGECIGERVVPPLWIALVGPLGAGKSVLARAVCHGAGIAGHIPSPSFTLVQEYLSPRGFSVHHVDLFRLERGDPVEPLGWDALLSATGIVLVEWADRAGELQPEDRWVIRVDYCTAPHERRVVADRLGFSPELIGW